MSLINNVVYNIKGDINKRILLLTDIHYYNRKDIKKLNVIYSNINRDIDYICICGDFIDEAIISDEDLFIDWLFSLTNICPVIMSIGGHDIIKSHKTKDYYYNKKLFNKINKIKNLYLLDNDVYIDNGIRFIGLNLPLAYYYEKNEDYAYFKEFINSNFSSYVDNYNILLCHSPVNLVKYKNDIELINNIDLSLCGHMHAGIVPRFLRNIFHGRGIFSPIRHNMFPNNAYGYFKRNNNNIIISSGVTKASHSNPFRCTNLLFDFELTYINIKKA